MKVETRAFGLIDVDERQKITVPKGLFGFESFTEYVILDAENPPFFWLQATAARDIAFILIDPFLFRPDYELDINDSVLAEIGITEPGHALIFCVVTIPGNGTPVTANLQGPLVINKETKIGCQAILADQRWKTKHDIMAELAAGKK
ncbi:MAG: flagellar assembly protein FliW [Spirochaetaceae bacterium]|nr:flagellar assembly protein FliW [Spirochaetaceae bacterium]